MRIDGVDLRELTFDALADAVGVVSQETYLFHASVRENLRFAKPDATDEEIEEAARAAQIHDTIADAARGLRHRRRRARLPLLRRREAADRDRPHDPAQPAGAGARRGHERAGRADRARRRRGARAARRGPHDDRHRAPALHRPRRRPDRRARPAARSPSAAPTRSCSRSAGATPRWSRATRAPPSPPRTSAECPCRPGARSYGSSPCAAPPPPCLSRCSRCSSRSAGPPRPSP